MIHYQLRCSQEHAFDGWFKDSAGFDAQVGRGLVECPQCGDTGIHRALMAPNLGRKGNARGKVVDQSGAPDAPAPSPPAVAPDHAAPNHAAPSHAAGRMPDHIRTMLQRLRVEVEKNCDHVGADFAEEARRIHRGESKVRGIYGDATPEQAEALAEEGIEVAQIPWVPRADG